MLAGLVQPSTTESKSTETKVWNSDSASSSPIRRPSSRNTSETLVKVTDEHITNASVDPIVPVQLELLQKI